VLIDACPSSRWNQPNIGPFSGCALPLNAEGVLVDAPINLASEIMSAPGELNQENALLPLREVLGKK